MLYVRLGLGAPCQGQGCLVSYRSLALLVATYGAPRRVAIPWGRQAPGSACDRLLPPPGRVAEPQRRAVLTLPQPRDRRGERFYEHARHPARERRPVNHLYGLVCGEGSAAVCYGEPLRGAAPGSEPNSGTTPPSPRSRRYGSPMRVDHSVSHDAPGLRRSSAVSIVMWTPG